MLSHVNEERKTRTGYSSKSWILEGLLWGAVMFAIMDIIYPLIAGVSLIPDRLWKAAILWLAAGLVFGFLMRYVRYSQKKEQQT